ncbi:hypothetical protein ACI2LC_45525 [Nonomuraea wenchangensis]|uniref:hypothetical protein n=1 Tax=Nonomuraea wenchangensis TaxID=568860 RepID=UPI00384D3C4D
MRLLIKVVHPVITSHEARQSTNEARTNWVVDDVAALTRAQFAITALRECAPRQDRFDGDMAEYARRRRVPLFLLLAGSRA